MVLRLFHLEIELNAAQSIGQQDIAFRQNANSNNEKRGNASSMDVWWTARVKEVNLHSSKNQKANSWRRMGWTGFLNAGRRRKPSRSMFRIHGVEGLRLSRWVWVESIFLPITIPRVRYCKFLHKRQKRTLVRQPATCKLQQVSTPRADSSVQSSPGAWSYDFPITNTSGSGMDTIAPTSVWKSEDQTRVTKYMLVLWYQVQPWQKQRAS